MKENSDEEELIPNEAIHGLAQSDIIERWYKEAIPKITKSTQRAPSLRKTKSQAMEMAEEAFWEKSEDPNERLREPEDKEI